MLEELNITNLGIVENASLPFTAGLNVLTGETGAGKSMILNGLGLLLGKRSKTSLVGEGKTQLTVEGCWEFDETPQFVEETNATVEDGQLFVSRTVKTDGKSRAVVGGRSIPVSVLSDISSQLVSIHGQSDQLKLKSSSTQLKIIDEFGGNKIGDALRKYKETYKSWVKLKTVIAEYRDNASLKQQEREFYEEVLNTFDKVDPQPGEDETLKQFISKLENLDAIRESMQKADHLLSNDEEEPDISIMFSEVLKAVQSASKMDEGLAELEDQAERLNTEIIDLSHQIGSYLHSVDYEAITSLNEAQERLSELSALNRRYSQVSLEESLNFRKKAEEWMLENQSSGNLEELTEELEKLTKTLTQQSDTLTKNRTATAVKLSEEMNEALKDLNMSGAEFLIEIHETEFASTGKNTAEFMLKAHKKATPQPVNKTASGGELSRIMLALETVTANTDSLTTFVFDEIDSGVGGETAVQIGKRLAELAKHSQVIVVTHLPQVAGFADNHLIIQKQNDDSSVLTTVKQATSFERREEIARMLSGLNDSSTGLAHADELLSFADTWKAS